MVNKFEDKQTQAIWEATQDYTPGFQPDVELGLRRLQDKINSERGAKIVPMRRPWLRAAAAAVALAVAAFVGVQYLGQSAEWVSVTAQNDRQEVVLPDGSQVWLKDDATLSYVADFAGTQRQLKLDGEAFFDVEHNPEKPFVIQAKEGTVTVLGTSFSVDTDKNSTEVLVKTGKVAFQANEETEAVYLTKNMKGVYADGADAPTVETNVSINELAWQTQVLQYRGVALTQIITDLETAFAVSIDLENKSLADCEYTDIIELDGKTINEALAGILVSTGLKMTEKNGSYQLSGGKSACR